MAQQHTHTHTECPYRAGYEVAIKLHGTLWFKEIKIGAEINKSHSTQYVLRALGFKQGIREKLIQQKLEGQNQ